MQGLRKHWGFYFSSCLRDFRSADLWEIVRDEGWFSRSHCPQSAESWFNRVILARLLLLHVFAEIPGVKHPPEKARDIWNSVQLSCQGSSDYPVQLWSALDSIGPVSSISDREREIMRDTVSSLRVLLGNDDLHLFCVFDDSELAQERRFGEGINLDWKSGLSVIGNFCTTFPWLTPVFSCARDGVPRSLRSLFSSPGSVVSGTGVSSPEDIRVFLRSYLPPSLVASDAGGFIAGTCRGLASWAVSCFRYLIALQLIRLPVTNRALTSCSSY